MRMARGLEAGLQGAWDLPEVVDARVLGARGVVELREPVDVAAATGAAVDAGVWLRPFRNLVYTMPPYITGDQDLALIAGAVVAAAAAGSGA
jgi:adenosylmethionine---8-amino-7-oxononanoate aminotransferase